jgi:hypothetical protein
VGGVMCFSEKNDTYDLFRWLAVIYFEKSHIYDVCGSTLLWLREHSSIIFDCLHQIFWPYLHLALWSTNLLFCRTWMSKSHTKFPLTFATNL